MRVTWLLQPARGCACYGRLPPAACDSLLALRCLLAAAQRRRVCLLPCYVTSPTAATNSWANTHPAHPIVSWQVKTALQDWEREQALYVEVGTLLYVVDAWEG